MTLPELAVAMTLSSLILTASVPSIATSLRSMRLNAAARDVASAMSRARAEAFARAARVGILFEHTPGGDGWRLYADGGQPGVHLGDIETGLDSPIGSVLDLRARHSGVYFGIPHGPVVPRIP
ncbi:MAG: Tfp pilus assembly protein FimT/FimU, partial [Acidobacteriota bacterium]